MGNMPMIDDGAIMSRRLAADEQRDDVEMLYLVDADREALVDKLKEIAKDPYGWHPYAQRLQGTPGFSARETPACAFR